MSDCNFAERPLTAGMSEMRCSSASKIVAQHQGSDYLPRPLTDCSKNAHSSNGHHQALGVSYGKSASQVGVAEHRSSNSYATPGAEQGAADEGVLDRSRGRQAHRGGQEEPVGSPRCDYDPHRVSPRPASFRADGPSL